MKDKQCEVLYYPNFNSKALPSIKQSMLLYDRIKLIAPTTTPLMGTILSDTSAGLHKIGEKGAIDESYDLYSAHNVVDIIPDLEIIQNRRDEFLKALNEDLSDDEVIAWEKKIKKEHDWKDLSWYVLPGYFNLNAPEIDNPNYQIEEVEHEKYGTLLRLPFLVGMSLGLSEALWASVDKDLTLFTDDDISRQFLMFRLKRGWKYLAKDPHLQKIFGIEQEFSEKIASATFGSWVLQKKIPGLVEKVTTMSIDEIIKLREKSNHSNVLKVYRDGISNLVMSHDIWESKTIREFENEAYKIFKKQVLPAFEELEKKRILSLKDVFVALDWKNALKETIKSTPSLFVSAAVPVATGGGLFFGAFAIAPAGILALGCGLGGHFVKNLFDQMSERLKNRRTAQFLTYPISMKKTLTF